jgi:AraC family transcriptional regulator, arabinose operon regulatory protein
MEECNLRVDLLSPQAPPPLFTGDLVTSRRIIYQPSRFAVDNLLYLQETGSLSAIKPHVSSRKDLSSYLFFIVTSGSGSLTYKNQTYKMKSGDCAFIDCRTEYSQSSSADDLWSLKWAHFNGFNMAGIYGKYLERGGEPCFALLDTSSIIKRIDLLLETASSSSYLRDMKINEHLSSLLTLIMEYSWNPEKAKTSRTRMVCTGEVRKYIDSNYREELSLEVVAKQFNINKSYLLRIFKEDSGITINNYILQQRILKAKNDLRFTGKTLEAIAEDSGFKDANYFIRMFKKIEGITPGEYRKQW